MSTLLERRPGQRPGTPASGPAVLATAGLAAVQAAAASLSLVLVPVVLAWATASFSSAPWGQALQFGVGTWLLAQHAGIVIPDGHVGLVPLGVAVVPLVCCWFAGVRLARNLDPRADRVRAGTAAAARPPVRALVALVGAYAVIATLAAVLGTSGPVRPLAAQAFVGAAVVCAVGGVSGAAAWEAGGLVAGLRLTLRRVRLPDVLRRCLPAAGTALALQFAAGAVLLPVAVGLRWDRVLALHDALHAGVAGGLVLVLAQATMVPNLVIWTLSFAAGPGFAIGTGTTVAPGGTELGPLPAVPLLGALPEPGAHPVWIWGLVLLPVLAGAAAGYRLWQSDPERGALPLLTDVLALTAVHAVLWTVLAWLSGGPAGPGRLATTGPVPWETGPVLALETGAGALLLVGAGLLMRRLAAPYDTATGAVTDGDGDEPSP